MAELFLHGRKPESIFQLLGKSENNITYSVGWAIAKCPAFLSVLLKELVNWSGNTDEVVIRLQEHTKEGGITDIEIEHPSEFFIIVEAKRGWSVPAVHQLQLYSQRKAFRESRARTKLIVAASECSREYALLNLPSAGVLEIPVMAISWKELHAFALQAKQRGSQAEKRLLEELVVYLRGLMTMQRLDLNWVFVVSISSRTEPGWGISWINIIKERHRYFHMVGKNGWPAEPPNYIAFRYNGRLQSIHHVEDYEIITNLHTRFEEIPDKEESPLFLYTLGAGFAPSRELPTGDIYPSGRVWCMLDTLFTSTSIYEARDISRLREARMGQG